MEQFITPYDTTDIAKEKERVLVIAPHCDDEVFGCGAALLKALRAGGNVHVRVVSRAADIETRREESLCAADIIGYSDIEFWEYGDGSIYDEKERLVQDMLVCYQELRPSLLFVPSVWEMHRDHLACCIASVEALKLYEGEMRVAMYEVGVALQPTHIMDVTDEYSLKRAAMECFASQLRLQNYKEQIEGLNTFRTYTLPMNVKYAEAFWVGDKRSTIELYESKATEQFYTALSKAAKKAEELWHLKNSYEQRFYESDRELGRIGGEINRLRLLNEEMQNTLSWKVTKPLRYLSSRLKPAHRELLRKILRSSFIPAREKVLLRDLKNKATARYKEVFYSTMNQDSNRELLREREAYIKEFPVCFNKLVLSAEELPQIDITVVTYNSAKWLAKYFDTLKAQAYPLRLINLYFTDNGSSDDTLGVLGAARENLGGSFGSFVVIESPNKGFGHGHNRAVEKGGSEFVLISNPDIEFEEHSIVNVVAVATKDAKEVASWELRQIPYEHPKHYDPVTWECSWSSHACILFRREAFESAGGYDERIFLYGEDVEFSYRLRSNGYKLRYCPSATVNHYTYETTNEIKPAQYVGSTVANLYLRARYGNIYDRLCILPLAFIGCFREPFAGAKERFRKDLKEKFLPYAFALMKERKKDKTKGMTPFRNFDYEFVREGAFYEVRLPKETPLVSIITRTVKGRERLLAQAGYGVFNQTYKNIEWIVVEDGGESAGATVEKLREISHVDIVYIPCDKIGRSAAGNKGLQSAKGRYAMFLDDDDLLYADHVEVLVEKLLKSAGSCAAYSLAWMIESSHEDGKLVENDYINVKGHHQEFDYAKLRQMNYIPIQSILFEKELFDKRGGFDTDIEHLEDWNLWQRYAHGNRFEYVRKTTSLYRVPMDMQTKASRQKDLDEAYEKVKEITAKRIDAS